MIEFILNNWIWMFPIMLEVAARLIKTEKDLSLFNKVISVIDFIIVNRKKPGGTFKNKVKGILILVLLANVASAQIWQPFKGIMLNGYDTITSVPSAIPPAGYGALTRTQDGLFAYDTAWFNLRTTNSDTASVLVFPENRVGVGLAGNVLGSDIWLRYKHDTASFAIGNRLTMHHGFASLSSGISIRAACGRCLSVGFTNNSDGLDNMTIGNTLINHGFTSWAGGAATQIDSIADYSIVFGQGTSTRRLRTRFPNTYILSRNTNSQILNGGGNAQDVAIVGGVDVNVETEGVIALGLQGRSITDPQFLNTTAVEKLYVYDEDLTFNGSAVISADGPGNPDLNLRLSHGGVIGDAFNFSRTVVNGRPLLTGDGTSMQISNTPGGGGSAISFNMLGAIDTTHFVQVTAVGHVTLVSGSGAYNGKTALDGINPKLCINTAGSNPSIGTATLVGGTVTVNNTNVEANSIIFLTPQNTSGTPGILHISSKVNNTSFTITSSSGTDTSTIGWIIVEARTPLQP